MNQSRAIDDFSELTPEQQERLAQVLDEYFTGLEQGRAVDRAALIARHPDLAEVLQGYLASLDFLQDAAVGFHPAAPGQAGEQSDEIAGRELGDFRLVREVGRGGMGIVYEAWQLSLNRRVALKVLPFAALLDAKQIARFRNEAQAAAQLHHSNIVPVFAVGVDRGVHYYAMQFIEGQPLDRVIARLSETRRYGSSRGSRKPRLDDAPTVLVPPAPNAAGPQAPLSSNAAPPPNAAPPLNAAPSHSPSLVDTAEQMRRSEPTVDEAPATPLTGQSIDEPAFFRQVAEIGIEAAEALHSAHELGVVHRDIKPSNLLLDVAGKLWVTDFGLARFKSDANLTRSGDFVGTMRYMSPEQARGQAHLVDHRTDIYSLGATLYELLTLHPALRGDDAATMLRSLDNDNPYRPRQWNPLIPIDLETIVEKALAKSRDERYSTAKELADDLRRFLDGRPTVARRPTLADRAAKWAWRHRRAVSATVVGLVVVVIGLAVNTAVLTRHKLAADAALSNARESFQKFRSQLAVSENHLAMLYEQNGEPREAEARYRESIRLHRAMVDEQPADDAAARSLAATLGNLAVLIGGKLPDEAQRLFDETIGIQSRLAAAAPRDRAVVAELALSHSNLGSLHSQQGDAESAVASLKRAIELLEPLGVSSAADAGVARDLAVCRNNLGLALVRLERFDEAEDAFRSALTTLDFIASQGAKPTANETSSRGGIYNNLGMVLERQLRPADAAAAYEQAVACQQAASREAPTVERFRQLLGRHQANRQRVLRELGKEE